MTNKRPLTYEITHIIDNSNILVGLKISSFIKGGPKLMHMCNYSKNNVKNKNMFVVSLVQSNMMYIM